jgi:hypothetical protein
VADVEHALKLGIKRSLIVKKWIFPIQRMAGWSFEIAFAGWNW